MQPTFRPNKRHRVRTHGFMQRMLTANGRRVLAARRQKGRYTKVAKRPRHGPHGLKRKTTPPLPEPQRPTRFQFEMC